MFIWETSHTNGNRDSPVSEILLDSELFLFVYMRTSPVGGISLEFGENLVSVISPCKPSLAINEVVSSII